MIETIRKHSKWLLWIIAGATIISMVLYMGVGPAHNGNGDGAVDTNVVGGEIYGQKVTADMYYKMKNDVDLDFLFKYGQWPEENPQVTKDMMMEDVYVRMMQVQKANQLGVHVTLEQVEQAAANFLRSPTLQRALGVHDEAVPLNAFIGQILTPHQLTEDDFESFVRNDLAIEQLQQFFGLPGELVTPQEVTNEYVRDNQQYSAQIVFFVASNYLKHVTVTPQEVAEYYTNFMADYRLPERVQVSYVAFTLTNYSREALHEIGKTNLSLEVQNAFDKYGMQAAPDAKTEAEAKAEIEKFFLQRQAFQDAVTQADNFAQTVFNMQPVSPQNLAAVAKEKGLTVEHPAPFSADYGPSEFTAPAAFTQTAFTLSPDSPISEPVSGPDAVYVIALENRLPSEIPALDEIRTEVSADLKLRIATATAQRDGTNFAHQVMMQMAAGESFARAGINAGLDPEVLPPFSLSTQDMPELGSHAEIGELKEAVVTTPIGAISGFRPTKDGGFILYLHSLLPIDKDKMASELPQFTTALRERRAQQTYSDWIQHEANRQLRTTPLARKMGMR